MKNYIHFLINLKDVSQHEASHINSEAISEASEQELIDLARNDFYHFTEDFNFWEFSFPKEVRSRSMTKARRKQVERDHRNHEFRQASKVLSILSRQ